MLFQGCIFQVGSEFGVNQLSSNNDFDFYTNSVAGLFFFINFYFVGYSGLFVNFFLNVSSIFLIVSSIFSYC